MKNSSPQQPECSLHSEKLHLFCVDDQDLVCLVCRDLGTHKDHRFRPIEEVAYNLREQLRSSIEALQNKLQVLCQSRQHFDSAVAHISIQAQQTQTQIRIQFGKLHQFLWDEEESRFKTLREEEEQKTQWMKDMVAAVSRNMEALSQTISETEDLLSAGDVSFLLQYKTAVKKVQHCPLVEEPLMKEGALIDQAKHLGNLGFKIWRKMKTLVQFYPVVLDPNTAGSELVLAEDLSSVGHGQGWKVLKNPERLWGYHVYGSEKLVSGIVSWDVEVGENKNWGVGLREYSMSQSSGEAFYISFLNGTYSVIDCGKTVESLSVKKLQRIRVILDFYSETVTFTDLSTNTELHTDKWCFSDRIFPYLFTKDEVPLKILPKNITVTVEP